MASYAVADVLVDFGNGKRDIILAKLSAIFSTDSFFVKLLYRCVGWAPVFFDKLSLDLILSVSGKFSPND